MIPLWLGKFIATRAIKAIKYRIDLKRIDKYVNKPNELDIQLKQQQKTIGKYGRYIEELEKEVAILKRDSHPPIFSSKDKKNITRRLTKLEKKEK
jgi:rRNA maturation protein Nop10|tara:strand:- start:408 stop:692 length:285 start_codon:yes stop_codon:yes gene_type:complete